LLVRKIISTYGSKLSTFTQLFRHGNTGYCSSVLPSAFYNLIHVFWLQQSINRRPIFLSPISWPVVVLWLFGLGYLCVVAINCVRQMAFELSPVMLLLAFTVHLASRMCIRQIRANCLTNPSRGLEIRHRLKSREATT